MTFDDFGTRVKKVRDDTVEGLQKANKVRQLNSSIHAEEKKVDKLYKDMGKKLYELYKDNALSEFEPEFETLAASFAMMDELQEQVRGVRGVQICPNCKAEVNAKERFCPNCGYKLPEQDVTDDEEPMEAEEDNQTQDAAEEEPAREEEEETAEEPEEKE